MGTIGERLRHHARFLCTDREALPRDVIELVVRASDVGGLYSETVVMVTVIDFNDNAPQFQQSRMFKVILECVQPGHVAARVTAFDPDQGSNGKVTYTVRSGSYDKFAINPQTGWFFDLFTYLSYHERAIKAM